MQSSKKNAIVESKRGRQCCRQLDAIKRVGARLSGSQKVPVLDARYTVVELTTDFL